MTCNMKNYVVHIKSSNQAVNHGLIIKKVHRVIQFNQKAWLKPYVDINPKLRKEAKMILKRISLSLWIMLFSEKHRDIKLITTDKGRNQLASEPIYHTTKYFSENVTAIQMKKKMNKLIYFGMSILDISKMLSKTQSKTMLHGYWQLCYSY